jgi:hypothetical protein
MDFLVWPVVTALLFYLAYRAIRGGFERPQSERLNGYGVFALILLFFVGVKALVWLFS